jgi:hypothetical protein
MEPLSMSEIISGGALTFRAATGRKKKEINNLDGTSYHKYSEQFVPQSSSIPPKSRESRLRNKNKIKPTNYELVVSKKCA